MLAGERRKEPRNAASLLLKFCAAGLFLLASAAAVLPQDPEPARQFDFWIGEWDVNLRMRQADGIWKDQHKAEVKIYSILGGKAILELWSEGKEGINGYSLRYYNPAKNKWDLWLNWAGKNRSGTNGLDGVFRHGRGEFYAEQKLQDGTTRISRYTFSDITPRSLRWDDGYSTDGGKTWSQNWIMEFTRKAKSPEPIGKERNLHTYFDGSRCDLPAFDPVERLVREFDQKDTRRVYNILDGCIAAGFFSNIRGADIFFTLTYNTYANVYELALLGKGEGESLSLYYGPLQDGILKLRSRTGESASIPLESGLDAMEVEYSGRKLSFITP